MPPVTGIQYLRCLRENGRARSFDTAFVYHTRLAAAASRSHLVEQLGERSAGRRARDPAIEPPHVELADDALAARAVDRDAARTEHHDHGLGLAAPSTIGTALGEAIRAI